MKNKTNISIAVLILTLFFSCSPGKTEVTKGFYMWQSGYQGHHVKNQKLLNKFNSDRLYLKLFEVSYNDQEGAIPSSKTNVQLSESLLGNAEIVPCIFIENPVLLKLTATQIEELADNILFLTNKYVSEEIFIEPLKQHKFKEIQIDCDWSKKSKKKYFSLLRHIKTKSNKIVSCTMRLYPYKYNKEMGTPPVDRVMLLCYNLLNPVNNVDKNTIFELEELKKYIDIDASYPLPVDVALPVYSSGYRIENNRFSGVFHAVPSQLEGALVPLEQKHHYVVKQDTFIERYFNKGEKLKIERVSESDLLEAAKILGEHFNEKEMNVALYHLDHEELKQYNHEILDSLYTFFE